MEIFSRVERRRRWSVEEKRRLVAAAFAPGAVVSDVARRADIHPNQLYRWRQDLCAVPAQFAKVVVSEDFPVAALSRAPIAPALPDERVGEACGMIEVVLSDWAQCRIPISVPADVAAAVIGALVRR
jgi:transposase